jgi:hypothetical protein
MKNFKEYLSESIKRYDFKVKVAGEFTTEQEDTMKTLLGRYTEGETLTSVKKSKTPIQALPLDFPQVKNCEVSIYEFSLDYPTTQQELTEYLTRELGVSKQNLVVRRPGEPTEEYQHIETTPREGALLDDPDYKEAGNPQFEDYFGDKYNTGFVKELNDLLKLERKARGEEIPMETAARYNTDTPAHTESVLKSATDPRKK